MKISRLKYSYGTSVRLLITYALWVLHEQEVTKILETIKFVMCWHHTTTKNVKCKTDTYRRIRHIFLFLVWCILSIYYTCRCRHNSIITYLRPYVRTHINFILSSLFVEAIEREYARIQERMIICAYTQKKDNKQLKPK
jgi:hypothetical protein